MGVKLLQHNVVNDRINWPICKLTPDCHNKNEFRYDHLIHIGHTWVMTQRAEIIWTIQSPTKSRTSPTQALQQSVTQAPLIFDLLNVQYEQSINTGRNTKAYWRTTTTQAHHLFFLANTTELLLQLNLASSNEALLTFIRISAKCGDLR